MQRYPIGIQDFEKLRNGNFVYVDKTQQIYQLLQEAGTFFLSRPRRFGKSLLLNTLGSIFEGKKHLFEGLWIENKIEWKNYPIIRLDFSAMDYRNLGLESEIMSWLQKNAKKYEITLNENSPKKAFAELILALSKIEKVVILIDEYDKPLIDYLEPDQIHIAKEHRDILKNFYGTLKNLDGCIRFLFITGVSKFSKVSIFSDLNHLLDISLNPKYGTLLGYTQTELLGYFGKKIEEIAQSQAMSYETLMNQIKLWYNGYAWLSEKVYNPFSVLCYLSSERIANYWFETGTPTFLVKILNRNFDYNFEQIRADDQILGSFQLENLNPKTLLFQTGYLTIQEQIGIGQYRLGYPNREVKQSLLVSILGDYTEQDTISFFVTDFHEAFEAQNWEKLQELINLLFSKIPHQIFDAHQEKYYHAVIFLIFQLLGYHVQAEVSTSKGRIDAVIGTSDHFFIIEFKLNDSAENAIRQIREKEYYKPYLDKNKEVLLVGIGLKSKEVENILVEKV